MSIQRDTKVTEIIGTEFKVLNRDNGVYRVN